MLVIARLTRSLAIMELKVKSELSREKNNISEQLHHAKNRSIHLGDEFAIILKNIEKHLGVETKDTFIDMIESDSKLLVTSKEIEEKMIRFETMIMKMNKKQCN